MDSKENWWRKPADSAAAAETAPQAGPEISGTFEDDVESKSLGEVIDQALGDFDSKLAQLKEQLEQRRAEVTDLEVEIADLEKDQAKAFKDLLSSNKHIKRILAPKSKRKSSSKRKKVSKRQAETPRPLGEDADSEPLL
ncbi:MAG: hypothetical protein ACYS15_00800 [Planctomycetota bacterium]|jgi:chromosome segregation ATPase